MLGSLRPPESRYLHVYRFAEIMYNPGSQTADNGTGLVWDDFYAALASEPYGVNIVGVRINNRGGCCWVHFRRFVLIYIMENKINTV